MSPTRVCFLLMFRLKSMLGGKLGSQPDGGGDKNEQWHGQAKGISNCFVASLVFQTICTRYGSVADCIKTYSFISRDCWPTLANDGAYTSKIRFSYYVGPKKPLHIDRNQTL